MRFWKHDREDRRSVLGLSGSSLITSVGVLVLVSLSGLASAQASSRQSRLRARANTRKAGSHTNSQHEIAFPSLHDSMEMASLSVLMYHFHRELNDTQVCDLINEKNYTIYEQPQDNDVICHWYFHERDQSGTQVMIASSESQNYLAVVFAGTDDLRTSLTDADILLTTFGDENFTLPDPRVRIHSGFNTAVFGQDVFREIVRKFDALRILRPQTRLFTTGHSLGASDSILTAVGLTLYYEKQAKLYDAHHEALPSYLRHPPPVITSLNFGCPRIGNSYWRDFVHMNPTVQRVNIWRVVLGWDLVPRLPKLIYHVGHTIQLYRNAYWESQADPENATAIAYYQHYGDVEEGLAGVPFGWANAPFIWVPGALLSHVARRYWEFLYAWTQSSPEHQATWVHSFVTIENASDYDDDTRPPNVDDDFWVDPPDDELFEATDELDMVSTAVK
jgi:hypothetical protein